MLFRLDGHIIDDDLDALIDLCSMIDERGARLLAVLRDVSEECPAHEEFDDLVGLGFVACQRYLTQAAAALGLDKRQALSTGPKTETGQFVSEIINTAANAWKHEGEWDLVVQFDPQDDDGLHRIVGTSWTAKQAIGAKTISAVTRILPVAAWDYKFVNFLALLDPELRFSAVVNLLIAWRDTNLDAMSDSAS